MCVCEGGKEGVWEECVGECIRKGGVAEEEGMAWESLSGGVCG